MQCCIGGGSVGYMGGVMECNENTKVIIVVYLEMMTLIDQAGTQAA